MYLQIGPRVWKTGLAVAGSVFITKLLNIPNPIFAGIAAIICIQPTVSGSIKKGVQRMQATILGAVCGVGMAYLFGENPLAIGCAVVITIWLCINLKWLDSLELAAIVALASMVGVKGGPLFYGIDRTISTFIGIVVATLFNLLFYPPDYFKELTKGIDAIGQGFRGVYPLLSQAFWNNDLNVLQRAKEQLSGLEEKKTEAVKLYNYTRRDMGYKWIPGQAVPQNIKVRRVWSYEKIVLGIDEIFASVNKVVEVLEKRIIRKNQLPPDGSYTPQFEAFLRTITDMLNKVGDLHGRVLGVLVSGDEQAAEKIIAEAEEVGRLEREIPKKIKDWQCEYGSMYIESLMEISVISFELVHVAEAIKEMIEKVLYAAKKGVEAVKG